MIKNSSNQKAKPYIGDYLWVGLAALILTIWAFNLRGVLESSGSFGSKLPGLLLGALFYWFLTRAAWRRTVWSHRRLTGAVAPRNSTKD